MGNLELDLKTPRSYQNVDSPGTNYAIEGLCQRVKSTTGNATSSRIGFSERVSPNLCYFYPIFILPQKRHYFCGVHFDNDFKIREMDTVLNYSLSISLHKIFSSIFNFLTHKSYLLQRQILQLI